MFDVLEHIENDRLAVKNVHHMLKKGGKFIVTVPAHRFLWSTIDTVSGHKRRYGVKELKKMFINNGFEILEARHFFSFLIPFFLLRKWLNQKKEHSLHEVNPGLQINRLLNWTFNALLTLEYYLFSRFSPGFGGSILMVGRKTNHQEKIFYKASWCPGG
jgi:SAM-dependent methyltransferase